MQLLFMTEDLYFGCGTVYCLESFLLLILPSWSHLYLAEYLGSLVVAYCWNLGAYLGQDPEHSEHWSWLLTTEVIGQPAEPSGQFSVLLEMTSASCLGMSEGDKVQWPFVPRHSVHFSPLAGRLFGEDLFWITYM